MDDYILKRNNVTVAGSGPQTIIFAHGFGGDKTTWLFVEPEFAKTYRTVLFDYVGSGGSDFNAYDAERYASIEGFALDVLEVCAALDITHAIFVGHSFSSMVGVVAAIHEPFRFSHLVMIGPNPRFLNDPPDYIGGFERKDIVELLTLMERNMVDWANFLAPVAMKNSDRPELSERFAAMLSAGDSLMLRRFADIVFLGDNRAYLPQCPVPAFILQCCDDSIAPTTAGEFIHETLPISTLHHMEASGHCPHISHPDETIRLIKDYLATRVQE